MIQRQRVQHPIPGHKHLNSKQIQTPPPPAAENHPNPLEERGEVDDSGDGDGHKQRGRSAELENSLFVSLPLLVVHHFARHREPLVGYAQLLAHELDAGE
nr:hypothetical protein Iba_contig446CG0010 [Ipomoea batatas]